MSGFPAELQYTKDHEWARVEGSVVTVGVTSFAVEQLGDVTLVELPGEGREVVAGKPFGVVESVKSVSDLFSPITGKVLSVNTDLVDHPELVNEDPYGKGWMVRIQASNAAELATLLDAAAYARHVEAG